jgi:hypothetical protein
MPLSLGNSTLNKFYVGATEATAVYRGSGKVWPILPAVYPAYMALGQFSSYDSYNANRVALIQPSGSLNQSFSIQGTGFGYGGNQSQPQDVKRQSDGKYLFTGRIAQYNGSLVSTGVIRLNSNGTYDSSFVSTTNVGPNNYPTKIALFSSGKVGVIGTMTAPRAGFCILNSNGTTDTNFVPAYTLFSSPTSLSITNDGNIILVGNFTSQVGGVDYTNRILKVTPTGAVVSTFNNNVGLKIIFNPEFTILPQVQALYYDTSNDKIYIGGASLRYAGSLNGDEYTDRIGVMRLNGDGTYDNTFTPVQIDGSTVEISGIKKSTTGEFFVYGAWERFGGDSDRLGVGKFTSTGQVVSAFKSAGSGYPLFFPVTEIMDTRDGGCLAYVDGYWDGVTVPQKFVKLSSTGGLEVTTYPTLTNPANTNGLAFNSVVGKIIEIS